MGSEGVWIFVVGWVLGYLVAMLDNDEGKKD